MRALGRQGGRARRKGVAEELPDAERQSLREQLRRGLDPELVVRTANEILAGENQTARGNMIRFLADLELYRKDGDEEDRARERAKAGFEARERLARLLAQRAAGHEQRQVRDALDELAAELEREAVAEHPDLIVGDVRSERAQAILAALEERGLIVGRGKVEQMAEQLAQERLQALREEHGIPA